ncbi:hypothetical protein M8J77_020624 [Diaphorina citri]|nr:hypothetical protein M8J77_020624 [Diaphorina citri]
MNSPLEERLYTRDTTDTNKTWNKEQKEELKDTRKKTPRYSWKCLLCDFKCRSKCGLTSHLRHKHPDAVLASNCSRAIYAPLTLSNPNKTSPSRPCPSQATNGAAPIVRDPSGPRRDCPVTLGATSAEFKDEDTS